MAMTKLFYVIGASGAGKDTLMNYARQNLKSEKVIFAHRYITRPPFSGNENHVSLSEEEFITRRDGGLFSLYWQSHNNMYGIGKEINLWLDNGFNVVVNGSREYLATATEIHPSLIAVLIEVSQEVLRKRLMERGREKETEIKNRLQRTHNINVSLENCIRIQNDGSVEIAGDQLIKIISQ